MEAISASRAQAQNPTVAGVRSGKNGLLAGQERVAQLAQVLREIAETQDEDESYLDDLLKDVDGQVFMALSRQDWFVKWGTHYLPSLQRAHLVEQCNNFKDPGVQHYGGALFRDVRDEADDLFNTLPPPVPSNVRSSSSVPMTYTMSSLNNAAGPCFARGLVRLQSGAVKPVDQVVAGDVLAVPGEAGPGARVECVVATSAGAELVELPGGVLVTPWHPVSRPDGTWVFPAHVGARTAETGRVYSFLLDRAHRYTVGAWSAVALGHGLQGDVVAHPFFGSRAAVVASLSALRGWRGGRVELAAGACLERDARGLVCGFTQGAAVPDALDVPCPPLAVRVA